jgi:hypothetical protein
MRRKILLARRRETQKKILSSSEMINATEVVQKKEGK